MKNGVETMRTRVLSDENPFLIAPNPFLSEEKPGFQR